MSAINIVIDDHLLLQMLLHEEPSALRPTGGRIFTTGLWYHRLCRALEDETIQGSMSRQLAIGSSRSARNAVEAAASLPSTINLVSLRQLAWPMTRLLSSGARLNLLSLEALAAAQHIDGEICLASANRNPPLLAAAKAQRVRTRVINL